MKIFFIAFLSLLCCMFYSQNQRFSYEYRFANDSTAKDKAVTELMYLDISKKGSKFYSRDKAVADSIFLEMDKKGNHDFDMKGMKFGQVHYTVEKSYPGYQITFFNQIDMDEFKVSDDRKMNWKILADKQKIDEFNTQKAVTEFAGREWTAWFTTEIPFQDGPYKFSGLPGLIVKIEDKTASHSYILKGVKNLKADEIWKSENDRQRYESLVSLTQQKYKQQFLDYRNNPTKGLRQMLARGNKVTFTDENGKELDTEKMMRDQEKNAKENRARNNNLLELDLLK